MKTRMFYTPSLQINSIEATFQKTNFEEAIKKNVTLSKDQKDIFNYYLQRSPAERKQIINENDLKSVIEVFYFLMNQSEHPDIITNIILLIDEFILAENNRIDLFNLMDINETKEMCSRLIRQMKSNNIALIRYSIEVFTLLTIHCGSYSDFEGVIGDYFQHIRSVFSIQSTERNEFNIFHLYNWSLFMLLNKAEYRKLFAREISLHSLVDLYDKLMTIQDNDLIYSLFHLLWLMTFDVKLVQTEFPEKCIAIFASVLLKIKIEKIIRIVLMTIHNLLSVDWYVRLLVQHEFNLIIPVLLSRTFSDLDIVALLNEINEVVDKKLTETSSMECYLDELKSGRMRWSPMHRSEQFWTENVTQFELDNWGLVKKLKTVINDKSIDDIDRNILCRIHGSELDSIDDVLGGECLG